MLTFHLNRPRHSLYMLRAPGGSGSPQSCLSVYFYAILGDTLL